jgi:hypothetical protein
MLPIAFAAKQKSLASEQTDGVKGLYLRMFLSQKEPAQESTQHDTPCCDNNEMQSSQSSTGLTKELGTKQAQRDKHFGRVASPHQCIGSKLELDSRRLHSEKNA